MIEKLRDVVIPPFHFSKTWTFDQVIHFFKRLRLKRRLKRAIKIVRDKNNG